MTESPVLLSVQEAAKLLCIGRNTLYAMLREHRLPAVRLGRRILIPRASLLKWLEDEAAASTDPELLRLPPHRSP